MDWYTIHGKQAASFLELPYETAEPGTPELFLVRGDPGLLPAAWRVTDPRQLTAEAAVCIYHKIPGGLVAMPLFNNLTAESQRGDQQVPFRRGAVANPMMWQVFLRSPVQPGDDHITLRYAWLGERVTVDIPLPEEGAS